MGPTQGTFVAFILPLIIRDIFRASNSQHNQVKCFTPGRFSERKIDPVNMHIKVY